MKKLIPIILLLAALCVLTACNSDRIPDPGTPEPPAYLGTFTDSSFGSLTFDGDGKSVTMTLAPTVADALGLPAGQSDGEYAFTFGNLGQCRYDVADQFCLTVGGVTAEMTNVIAGEEKTGLDQIVLTVGEKTYVLVRA